MRCLRHLIIYYYDSNILSLKSLIILTALYPEAERFPKLKSSYCKYVIIINISTSESQIWSRNLSSIICYMIVEETKEVRVCSKQQMVFNIYSVICKRIFLNRKL